MLSKLQYISQGITAADQFRNIQTALDAGCNWVQLRWKDRADEAVTELGARVKNLSGTYKATFILNDAPHIARAIDADGVHLGLTDMPVEEARLIIGAGKLVGGTANTLADVLQRVKEQCDYIGLGPFRFTSTKEKLSPVLGTAGYQDIMDALSASDISIPVYAIGGITLPDLEPLMQTGIYGIALSGLISKSTEPQPLVQQLNQQLYAATSYSR